jgi:glutamate/tyrosine decarboxylase-like PLP-dependent enzyme
MVLAIAGIGSDNVVGISVDNGARIDIAALEEKLDDNLRARQPVFAVVAIVGSTEGIETDLICNISNRADEKNFQRERSTL